MIYLFLFDQLIIIIWCIFFRQDKFTNTKSPFQIANETYIDPLGRFFSHVSFNLINLSFELNANWIQTDHSSYHSYLSLFYIEPNQSMVLKIFYLIFIIPHLMQLKRRN